MSKWWNLPTANIYDFIPSGRRSFVRCVVIKLLCSGSKWYFIASSNNSLHCWSSRISGSVSTQVIRNSRPTNGRRTWLISWKKCRKSTRNIQLESMIYGNHSHREFIFQHKIPIFLACKLFFAAFQFLLEVLFFEYRKIISLSSETRYIYILRCDIWMNDKKKAVCQLNVKTAGVSLKYYVALLQRIKKCSSVGLCSCTCLCIRFKAGSSRYSWKFKFWRTNKTFIQFWMAKHHIVLSVENHVKFASILYPFR